MMMTAVIIDSLKSALICSLEADIFWLSRRLVAVLLDVSPSERLAQHQLASPQLLHQPLGHQQHVSEPKCMLLFR